MHRDEQLVDRIVAGVLARLGQPTPSVQPSSVTPTAETETNGPPSSANVWNENVITAELVIERLKGNTAHAGLLHIANTSILTPSALDELRSRGVTWTRTPETTKPADAGASRTWKMILQQVTPQVKAVMKELQVNGPATWIHEIAGTLDEAIAMAVTPLSRAEVAGVMILTDRARAAACKANRHASLRAAVVQDLSEVASIKNELGANVYCLSPQGWGGLALRKLIVACIDGGPPAVPARWET